MFQDAWPEELTEGRRPTAAPAPVTPAAPFPPVMPAATFAPVTPAAPSVPVMPAAAAAGVVHNDPAGTTDGEPAVDVSDVTGHDALRMAAVLAELAARNQGGSAGPTAPPAARPSPAKQRPLPPVAGDRIDPPGPAPARWRFKSDPAGRTDGRESMPPVFRPDIEGLRAIAIMLVVAYHAGPWRLTGGFVGVDVFFVISGFLITGQLLREAGRTGRVSVARFYGRRVLRLLPAASLVIGATLLAGWWWLPITRIKELARDAIAANGYVINYRLAWLGTDYRGASAAPSPLQHFWSLAVEEQFYLVVPLLLLVTVVLARSRGAFVAVLAAATAGSLYWSVRSSSASSVWAYFGAPARVWELGAGALLAVAGPALARRAVLYPPAVGGLVRWAGVAAIGVAAVRFDEHTVFPGWAAALPVAGAFAVIAAGCLDEGNGSQGLLGTPLMRAIGARSYSWYLWHWPVLLIGPFVLSREFGPIARTVAVVVAFGLAAVSFELVEKPLRHNEELRSQPLKAAALGLALTATLVGAALLLPHVPSRTPLGVGSVADVTLAGNGSAQTKALARRITAAGSVGNLPANLRPSLAKAAKDDPVIYRDGCHLNFDGLSTPRHCERFGDPAGKRVIALFGDSHAAQWFPAVDSIAKKRHWRLAVFTKGACSAADVKIYLPPIRRNYDECPLWRRSAEARLKQLHPTVIVTSSNADGGDPQGLPGSLDRQWTDAWSRTIDDLSAPGTRVVYLNDTPWPKGNVPDCLAKNWRSVQKCAQSTKIAAGSQRRTMMARAASHAGAAVVDPTPWFCSLQTCPVVVGNILVYKDDSHVSTVWSTLLGPVLGEKLPGR